MIILSELNNLQIYAKKDIPSNSLHEHSKHDKYLFYTKLIELSHFSTEIEDSKIDIVSLVKKCNVGF